MTRWVTTPTLGTFGRLGNQLWQIAAAWCHAKRNDAELRLPLWEYRAQFPGLEAAGVTFHRTLESAGMYAEPRWSFDRLPPYWDGMGLHGYWQSPDYWGDQWGQVRALLTPIHRPEVDPDLCTMHVRRGDYLRLPGHHVTPSHEWYDRARAMLPDTARIVICTDDPVWCAREWPTLEVSTRSEVHDLALMAAARMNIIAPSSLSWWGAFLGGSRKGRDVIAPRCWFGPRLSHYDVMQIDPGEGWKWLE